MSITDELRTGGIYRFPSNRRVFTEEELTAIADRIDAALAEHYVELPKDADGEYIHIGDVMELVRYKDDDQTIMRTVSGIGNGVFFAWSDEQGRYAQYEAHAYRHHHAPTVEDVLWDMHVKLDEVAALHADEPTDSDERERDVARIFAEYAAKLQLRGDAK